MPKGKNKKVIGLIKDELRDKIMSKFVGLRAKTYSYLTHDGNEENKKHKNVCQKNPKFKKYKKYLKPNQLDNKINYPEKKWINIGSLKKIRKNS